MNQAVDIDVLAVWILICVIVAAIGTTAVPILYSFSPWRSHLLGQLFMLQAISFALAVDFTALFAVWSPKNILVMFWVNTIVFTAIAVSTSSLALLMWKLNHPKKRKNHWDGWDNAEEPPADESKL